MGRVNYPTSFSTAQLDKGMAILYLGFDGASPTYCAGLIDDVVITPTFNAETVTQGTPAQVYSTDVMSDDAEMTCTLRQLSIFHLAIMMGVGKSAATAFYFGGNSKPLRMTAKVVHETPTAQYQVKIWETQVVTPPPLTFNKDTYNVFPLTMKAIACNTTWDASTLTDASGAGSLFWVETYAVGESHTDQGLTAPSW